MSYTSSAKNEKMINLEMQKVRRNLFAEIRSMKETHSIWWDPSDRLKEMCGGRGCIQLEHFDLWTIFPAFVEYKKHWSPSFPLIRTTEEAIEYDFRKQNFHADSGAIQLDGCCRNCILYGFPCLNYCHEHVSDCKVPHLWNIKDEPTVIQELEYAYD